MKRINEIFYSLQGEGRNAGRAATFIRFSGCNLRCPFCDTDHSSYREMTDEQILEEVKKYPSNLVVLTGGEPTLYVDDNLIDKLHTLGKEVAIETNGTRPINSKIDFVTISPKFEYVKNGALVVNRCDELKVIYDGENDMELYSNIEAKYKFIQPCDSQDIETNQSIYFRSIKFVREHPEWRLSIQIQKFLSIR